MITAEEARAMTAEADKYAFLRLLHDIQHVANKGRMAYATDDEVSAQQELQLTALGFKVRRSWLISTVVISWEKQ